ncbi:MAG: radical SAM protein, partial [Clostridia bacterium]|nr:radical SAM protein [Clostridia bacterium]
HSPEYVLEWISRLSTEYPIRGLYFLDNNFLVDRERAADICEKLIATGLHRKIKFAIQAGVSCIDPEIVKLLKKAGCILLEMGIETSSQAQLDSVHKGTTVDMNRQALEMCRRAGLAAHAYLMQGFKGETMSDLERHLNWLKKAGNHFTVSMGMLQLYPGTQLYQKYGNSFFEENPWTEEAVTTYYQQDHLSAVSPAERSKWHKKYFKAAARRRNRLAILRHNPPTLIFRLLLGKIWRRWSNIIIFY